MRFDVQIEEFAKATNSTLDESVRAITLELFAGIIGDTRVDTGRLRGNWQTSAKRPIYSQSDRLDPNGSAATQDAQRRITSGDVVYLTNNLPYARVWEERDGMVARNMARLTRTIEEVARRARQN
jgi:hypothetical protein